MGRPMDFVETKIFREPWDVDQRLNELELTRSGLLEARDVAMQKAGGFIQQAFG